MNNNPRARRLGAEIQRELTQLLRRDVKDERIGNVTITAVDVAGDLRTAKVYYLVFGKDGADPRVRLGIDHQDTRGAERVGMAGAIGGRGGLPDAGQQQRQEKRRSWPHPGTN